MRLSLEYIAGYVDADGTIVIVNTGRQYYGKVCVYSQNLTVLENIKAVIGGTVCMTGMVFNLQLPPRATVRALRELMPFLQVKKEQAALVLELHRHIAEQQRNRKSTGKQGGRVHEAGVWEYRAGLALKMKQLNSFDSQAFRTNRVNSVKTQEWATPSQAAEGEVGSAEGVTTSSPSPNSNESQECPARKGRDSLSSTVLVQ